MAYDAHSGSGALGKKFGIIEISIKVKGRFRVSSASSLVSPIIYSKITRRSSFSKFLIKGNEASSLFNWKSNERRSARQRSPTTLHAEEKLSPVGAFALAWISPPRRPLFDESPPSEAGLREPGVPEQLVRDH